MSLPKILACFGFGLLNTAVLISQAPPKNKTLTNVVGYQLYQQKKWSESQLPKNSMQYKSDFRYQSPADYKNTVPNLQLRSVSAPDIKRNFFIPPAASLPGVISFASSNGISYYKWQKKDWWKYLPE